jgi:hypothetical protein
MDSTGEYLGARRALGILRNSMKPERLEVVARDGLGLYCRVEDT